MSNKKNCKVGSVFLCYRYFRMTDQAESQNNVSCWDVTFTLDASSVSWKILLSLLPSLGIRRPLTFHILIFSETQMKWNLVGSIYGRSFLKIANLVPFRQQTWPPQAILVSDWLISKKSSPLKPIGQMNRNLVRSILGRSSIKISHLFPIC